MHSLLIEKEKAKKRYREEREYSTKERKRNREEDRQKKTTANRDKWPNDHGGLTRVLFPRRGP